jgi:hypothetical protein
MNTLLPGVYYWLDRPVKKKAVPVMEQLLKKITGTYYLFMFRSYPWMNLSLITTYSLFSASSTI